MTFTVWVDHGTEGWYPSPDLPDLAAVLIYLSSETYGHPCRVTREIELVLTEKIQTQNSPKEKKRDLQQ